MQCECVIGVWKWEKKITQTLVLDIDLAADISRAAETDKLEHAINYKQVAERVIEFAQANTFDLIESLVERLAQLILDEFDTPWVRISLDKGGAVKNVKHVGVVIERGQQS